MIYERIYKQLEKLGVITLIEREHGAAKSSAAGFMDLHFENFGRKDDVSLISLSHYYEQNGDLCFDPDMEIKVHLDLRMAEATMFRQAYPPVYTEVYPSPGKVNPRAKKSLNAFLATWLRNCEQQGHTFTGAA